jgi:hypothetical protein
MNIDGDIVGVDLWGNGPRKDGGNGGGGTKIELIGLFVAFLTKFNIFKADDCW